MNTMNNAIPCPRCNALDTELMTQSKTAGWTVHLCGTCFYSWRSSEPAAFTQHDLYDSRFRLSPERIAHFSNYPPIPAQNSASPPTKRANEQPPIRRGGADKC